MTDGEQALQRMLADACLGGDAGDRLATDLKAFLEARGVFPDDIHAILAAPPRIAIYRGLVRNGLSSVVDRLLPRTRARMNTACAGRFDRDFGRFLDVKAPRTHYLRDVPAEFFQWISSQWKGDPTVPAYLVDLAAHELACFSLTSEEAAEGPVPVAEIDLERSFVFAPATTMARYAWAVHTLPEDALARVEPERRQVTLLGYRDESLAVHWLELSPLAAAIVARLRAGQPLGASVSGACAECGAPSDLADVARLLADLGARGVVLGAGAR